MDGKLQMGPKAKMQIVRAVIRSIWQHHSLKASSPRLLDPAFSVVLTQLVVGCTVNCVRGALTSKLWD